jgi:tetratricopeptide (TPR) repeat protein
LVALILVALAWQVQQPEVSATVDRTAVAPGDTVVLTIRVVARGNEPVRVAMPDLAGLELIDARESSRVQMRQSTAERVTVRVLRLRAVSVGRAVIGSVRVEQDARKGEAPAIAVEVTATATPAPPALDRSIRQLIDRMSPPAAGRVVVAVLPSRRSVVLGDQVDLVTVAWFPRDVRSRLRGIPTFEGPEVEGAWSYQHSGPAGVALSRRVGDTWYDLFVQYETVFPLQTGAVRVGRAAVSYSLPLTYSFLSRELRHVVQSDSMDIEVAGYPPAKRPAGFRGSAGGSLALRVEPTALDLTVGDARTFSVALEGRGNVSLWPEPEIRWPIGLRTYPGDVQVTVSRDSGVIRGSKQFTYLLVPDSAGAYRIASPTYPYYDLDQQRYVVLAAAPLEIVVRPGAGPVVARVAPPPLLPRMRPAVFRAGRLPGSAWWLIGLAPFAVLGVFQVRRLPRRRRASPRAAQARLDWLERRFARELERIVPRVQMREGDGLADALRAAGVEAPLAAHVARVRDRLRQALYGPQGTTDPEELRAEVEEVLRVLLGTRSGKRRSGAFARLMVLCLLAGARGAPAQDMSPERLYAAGAFRAAADSFGARAAHEPDQAANWYNLGNAWYRLGEDARAQAAWVRAARLLPRAGEIERAMSLVPSPDPSSERLLWVGPVTPDEALATGLVLWIAGWVLLWWRRVRPIATGALVAAAVAVGYGALALKRYRQPVAVTLATETPLREAPYGSASAPRRLREGTAVLVRRERGGWMLVSYGGAVGWVERSEVERL